MTTTITDGTTTVTPILITGWDTARAARNVLHEIIERPAMDVTYRPAGLRYGTLEALLPTLEDALTLEALLALARQFTLEDTDHPSLNMAFVASGDITVTLDDETRIQATVGWDFQEVTP